MKLFDSWKRHKATGQKADVDRGIRYRSFDKADYYYETALKNYCFLYNKQEDALLEQDNEEIFRFAGTHIGLFLCWIIKNHWEGALHQDEAEALAAVRAHQLSGIDFLMTYCDGTLNGEDLSDEIFPFVNAYYEKDYLSDYSRVVVEQLHDLPFEFVGSWEDYEKVAYLLDEAYARFQNHEL